MFREYRKSWLPVKLKEQCPNGQLKNEETWERQVNMFYYYMLQLTDHGGIYIYMQQVNTGYD